MSAPPDAPNDDTPPAQPVVPIRQPPPARPPRSSAIASPLRNFDMARPLSLTVAVVLWCLSCVAGLLIIVYFVTSLDGVRILLEPVIRERDPDISQSALDNTVITVIIASLGLVGVFAMLELWLALLMGSQRNWARVLLVPIGIIGLSVTVATCLLLTDGGLVARRWLLATLGAQVLLAVIGTITMYLPEPNRWFRMRLRHE